MRHIYVILFASALSVSVFSCKEKIDAEKSDNPLHESAEHIKDSTTKKELEKTTENGGDAH